MKRAEIRKAERLAAMANELHAATSGLQGISYLVEAELEVWREGGSVWYPMIAVDDKGECWNYWLAADSGSYKGSF